MRRRGDIRPVKRAGTWYLKRRVPKEFAHLDRRDPVRLSTEIAVVDDPRGVRARRVVEQLNMQLEAYWRGLRDGQSAEAKARFEAAQKRARALGFTYQTASELRDAGRIEDVLSRVELLLDRNLVDSELDVTAVLGGEARPRFRVSDLPGEYEKLEAANLATYSEKQRRRWRNPKIKAVNNLTEALGGQDKYLDELTRADAITFREWWQVKLANDGLEIGTANKDFGHINKMHRELDMKHHLGLPPVFARMRMAGETTGSRAAFSPEQSVAIVLSSELDRMKDEARDICLIVAETGMRPSEICGLLPHHIHVDAPIPFVQITPEHRQLKIATERLCDGPS